MMKTIRAVVGRKPLHSEPLGGLRRNRYFWNGATACYLVPAGPPPGHTLWRIGNRMPTQHGTAHESSR